MDYRLYLLNDAGHIVEAVELECGDDAEAIEAAEKHRGRNDVELWEHSRLVKKLARSE